MVVVGLAAVIGRLVTVAKYISRLKCGELLLRWHVGQKDSPERELADQRDHRRQITQNSRYMPGTLCHEVGM